MILLQTLIAGWDELECHRVFSFLCDLTNLLQKIEAAITAKPGVFFRVTERAEQKEVRSMGNKPFFFLLKLLYLVSNTS